MGSKLKILKNQYVFSVISEAISILSAFVFTVFQARFLGAELKGQIATINSVLSITSIVFGFGIYQTYPYYRKNNEGDMRTAFVKIALMMIGSYMAIAVGACLLLKLELKYAAILLLTPVKIYDLLVSEIVLIENPNQRNGICNFVRIAELVFVFLLWQFASASLTWGVIIILFEMALKSVILTWSLRDSIFKRGAKIGPMLIPLVKFGFFPMLSILMASLNYRLNVLMLNGQVSDASIGVYSVGVLLADRIWLVPDAMKGVMMSNITKGKASDEVAYVMRICNTLCFCLVIGIAALGEPFLNLVFGPEYRGAYPITLILLVGVFPMIAYKIIAAYNIVLGRQRISFILLTISVVCNVISNYFLIPVWGIYGAGISSVISYMLCSVLFVIDFCRQTHISVTKLLVVNLQDIKKLKSYIAKKK